MKKDEKDEDWISIDVVFGLKNVSQLCQGDITRLIEVLKLSEKLVLNSEGTFVKRKVRLTTYETYKDSNRTIFVDRLPPGSTVRSVKTLFSRFGKVCYVLRADQMIGIPGLEIHKLTTPQSSPKLKPRSSSCADANRLSPSLIARRLGGGGGGGGGGTPVGSPSLTSMNHPHMSHLSPAQRNRAIAAAAVSSSASGGGVLTTPIDPADIFSAAFIQFEKSACCKKAVSHIVAYNKQLKAMTPKGSPRVPFARRGSHSGVPILPPSALGTTANSVVVGVGAGVPIGSSSTPPKSRSISISTPQGLVQPTPAHGAAVVGQIDSSLSPTRTRLSTMVSFTGDGGVGVGVGSSSIRSPTLTSVNITGGVPPIHPTATISPPPVMGGGGVPPRHTSSPGPLSPPYTVGRDKRAQSVTSPTPYQMVLASSVGSRKTPLNFESPTFSPMVTGTNGSGVGGVEGILPELSLNGDSSTAGVQQVGNVSGSSSSSSSMLTPPTPLVVSPLPEQFIGMFVMPKISYLKSLKTRPGETPKKKDLIASANANLLNSPSLVPTNANNNQQQEKSLNLRESSSSSSSSSLSSTTLASSSSTLASTSTSTPSTTAKNRSGSITSMLSASAPVFQPSTTTFLSNTTSTPTMTPIMTPMLSKPLLGTSSPTFGARTSGLGSSKSTNWRGTPTFGATPSSSSSHHTNSNVTMDALPEFSLDSSSNIGGGGGGGGVGGKKKGLKQTSSSSATSIVDGESKSIDSPNVVVSDRPRFSLTNTKRTSLGGATPSVGNGGGVVGSSGGGVITDNVGGLGTGSGSVRSRFAMGPTSAEAIGFQNGRGRRITTPAITMTMMNTPNLAGAGGGRIISQQ